MSSGEDYRHKALEFGAKAHAESDPDLKAQLNALALSYLRLAEQADRNSLADIVYEPPPPMAVDPVDQDAC
jgi:hypothetical protein